jgi:hypothetical protein
VADVMIATIDFHGGMTRTISLEPGSPAIDASPVANQLVDQRGQPRPIDGDGNGQARCDAGAYEYNPAEILIDGLESGTTDAWTASR